MSTKSGGKSITICSTSFHQYDRRLIRIGKALIDAGYTVTWISRGKLDDSNSPFIHLIIDTLFKSGVLFYLEFNWKLFWKLIFHKTDCINAIDLDTIPASCLANIFKNKKLVFDAHEIYYEVPELTGKAIKKNVWKIAAKLFLPHIKYNYTVNHSLREHYYTRYRRAYAVIRNVPSKSKNLETSKSNQKKLCYLGVVNKGRGLELAIEVMRKLPDYSLTIIGEGDLYEELKKEAIDLPNVEFLGYVEPDKIGSILNTCSIGLNMLQAESLNYVLSLANKFFDYMHAGLPSINMSYPEYENILKKHPTGLMVSNYTAESLSSALSKLEDTTKFQSLVDNCMKYKEHYSWENEQQKLVAFYHNIFV